MRRAPAPPAVLLLLLLALAGCGGGDGEAGASEDEAASATGTPSSEPSTATRTYFVEADSDAINAAAAEAQASGARAAAPKQTARCGRVGERQGYPAWRRCWHGLLDPFVRDLGALGSTLGTMAGQDLPAACQQELRSGKQRFTRSGGRVDGLLTGIDAEERAAQERSMASYDRVLQRVGEGFAPYFQDLTRACYSPGDLESIDAAAEASASSSPTPEG